MHSPEAVQPPREQSTWTWGREWNLVRSPKAWTTDTIPGRKPFSSTAARLAPQDGHTPRRLQEKATIRYQTLINRIFGTARCSGGSWRGAVWRIAMVRGGSPARSRVSEVVALAATLTIGLAFQTLASAEEEQAILELGYAGSGPAAGRQAEDPGRCRTGGSAPGRRHPGAAAENRNPPQDEQHAKRRLAGHGITANREPASPARVTAPIVLG
jgi:hypothetical protein